MAKSFFLSLTVLSFFGFSVFLALLHFQPLLPVPLLPVLLLPVLLLPVLLLPVLLPPALLLSRLPDLARSLVLADVAMTKIKIDLGKVIQSSPV